MMRHIVLPITLTDLPREALYSAGLEDIVLPYELKTIGMYALNNGSDYMPLESLTIPSKVTDVGSSLGALNGNARLITLRMKPTTPPNIAANFIHNGSLKEIIVPAGCGEAYKTATNWSYYADIIKEEEI